VPCARFPDGSGSSSARWKKPLSDSGGSKRLSETSDGFPSIQGEFMSFRNLGLTEELVRSVEKLGYQTPTPIQAAAIPSILEGRDVVGTAQTGTGKTAAFTLPLLQRLGQPGGKVRALILTPTRELAQQVESSLQGLAALRSWFLRFMAEFHSGGRKMRCGAALTSSSRLRAGCWICWNRR
jgi:superfamily II DNA/RNA helicase